MKKSARLASIVLSPLLFIHLAVLTGFIPKCHLNLYQILTYSFYTYIFYGLCALVKVFFLAMTFNNCDKAAQELRQQIQESKKDLHRKGFKFD